VGENASDASGSRNNFFKRAGRSLADAINFRQMISR